MIPDIGPIVWNHLTRKYPDAREISVDDLEASISAEGNRYTRNYHLIPALQAWSAKGFGRFVVGRRRSPTRISFPKSVRLMGDPPSAEVDSSVVLKEPPMLDLPLPLRPGVVVRIQVPADVTSQECERICRFVQLIPLGSEGDSPHAA